MLVMMMLGAHAVDLRVTTEEKILCECEMTWREEGLTAVMVPRSCQWRAVERLGRGGRVRKRVVWHWCKILV